MLHLAYFEGQALALRTAVAVLLLAISAQAAAAHSPADPAKAAASAQEQQRAWEFGVAVGYGQRSNPLVNGDTLRLYADVDIAWYGERWFFDGGDLGYTLHNGALATVNLLARINSDRLFFSRTSGPVGLISSGTGGPLSPPGQPTTSIDPPDRSWTLEGGIEVLAEGTWGFLQSALMHDTLNRHSGYEASISYGYGLVTNRWYVEPSVRVMYKSSELNDYYWGLRPDETPPGSNSYQAAAGVNWLARCSAAYRINEHMALSLAVEYERLNDAIQSSPIVNAKDVVGFFVGLGYRF